MQNADGKDVFFDPEINLIDLQGMFPKGLHEGVYFPERMLGWVQKHLYMNFRVVHFELSPSLSIFKLIPPKCPFSLRCLIKHKYHMVETQVSWPYLH